MYKRLANPVSYDNVKRSKKNIKAIVIHGTGVDGDTAKGNVDFFATYNKREAGAHFFVDRAGKIARSIPMNRVAWAVGGCYNHNAPFYNILTNYNTVSIELCDIKNKYPSKKQIKATKQLIKYITRYCTNITRYVRHYDINGKCCPNYLVDRKQWQRFLDDLFKA